MCSILFVEMEFLSVLKVIEKFAVPPENTPLIVGKQFE